MENDPQLNSLPIQPSPEIIPTASSSTNFSKIILFIMLALITGVGLLFVGVQIGKQTINQQESALQKVAPSAQTAIESSPAPTLNSATNSATTWKIYSSAKYTFKYPSEWIIDEKCTKLDYPSNNLCVHSPDYQPVTQKIDPPGEGGIDTLTEYNIGTFLSIGILNNVPYDATAFCSPGGPASISNCKEKMMNENKYATREIGSYPYPTVSTNAWLIINNYGVANLDFSFSKENKAADLQIFDQILASFQLIK